MMNTVYIYAFDAMHRVVDVKFLRGDAITIQSMRWIAEGMTECVDARCIYAVDNRFGLKRDYMESIKSNDFTKHYEFEDLVSRAGLKLFNK